MRPLLAALVVILLVASTPPAAAIEVLGQEIGFDDLPEIGIGNVACFKDGQLYLDSCMDDVCARYPRLCAQP